MLRTLTIRRYLYERENYVQALDMLAVAIKSFADKNTLAYASAIELFGLLHLDNAQPTSALERFEDSLKIRESILGPDDPFIAASLNTIAIAYTELDMLKEAYDTHQKAIDIRLPAQIDRIGNSYSNMASTLLRMGKPDEAEEMLARCPSLKDFNDETFLSTGNPRFSGDMVLLSRIRAKQGRLDDAVRLSSKALGFRQAMLGNRLKTCDAMYLVAKLLLEQGNVATAATLLNECVAVSESLQEGKGHLARAQFKLGELWASEGDLQQSELSDGNKKTARALGRELLGVQWPIEDNEASYDKLVVWMLW